MPLQNTLLSLEEYNNLITNQKPQILSANGVPIKAVSQRKKSKIFDQGYEPSIYLRGELQTRENNWHDFFNLKMWLTFPKTKAIVNKWQYLCLKKRYPDIKQRYHMENLLTQFDEGGMIVVCDNTELIHLLKTHQWKNLFWYYRQDVIKQMQFYLFGHALHEKMLNPYIGITACSLIFEKDNNNVDQTCADFLDNPAWCENIKTLYPVPILGIPGWYEDNKKESFYENKNYFRD